MQIYIEKRLSSHGQACGFYATIYNYTQGKILGFFGIIGPYQTTLSYDTSANQVTGLYLDNFTIKNSASTTSILAGFLAGYVNGTLTNSGVGYAHFDFVNGTMNISSTSSSSTSSAASSSQVSFNRFNQFAQRSYDYDELEARLLSSK